jgi:predicted kinase
MDPDASTTQTLVLMAGLPGTGKSTLACAIAKKFGWVVLDKDLIHSAMIANGMGKLETTSAAYEASLALVKDLLERQQQSVILDTAGRQPFLLERSKEIVSQCGARLRIMRCVAPKEVRMTRLTTRSRHLSQWSGDFASDDEQELWYSHLPGESLLVQSDKPFEVCLNAAVEYLSRM